MRKLTEQELDSIHARLKSLRIQYIEVYEEVFDHYHSALELCSESESEEILRILNIDFSIDSVRQMEENLKVSAKKLLIQLQWNELKFWKAPIQSIIYQVLLISVLALMYYYFDVPGMYLWVGIFSLVNIPIIWFCIWNDTLFSIRKLSIGSSKAFANQILNRSGMFYFGLMYFGFVALTWNDANYGLIEATVLGAFNIFSLLNMLTLVQVALKWKQKQTRIAS